MLQSLLSMAALCPLVYGATDAVSVKSNWAVLVAGSNGYYNYRHQSDVAHAYQILTELGGFPKENIIVMIYDDVANSTDNPFPGQLFNQPNGVDYYAGIDVSYRGNDVTADNFMKVLKGIPPSEGAPVLQSTAGDNVFIYFADHGATGLIAFPVGNPLYASDLIDTLEYMHSNQMYNELVFYMEACESGSMFNKLLPSNLSIFATTAANPYESSFAFYYNSTLGTYMADEYSIRWMQDSEANWADARESLSTQFSDVKSEVSQSHPQQYGDFKFVDEAIEDFQAYEDERLLEFGSSSDDWEFEFSDIYDPYLDYSLLMGSDKHYEIASFIKENVDSAVDSRNVKLFTLYHRLVDAKSIAEEELILEAISAEIEHRTLVTYFFTELVSSVIGTTDEASVNTMLYGYTSPRDFACLKGSVSLFTDLCEPFSDYSYKYVRTLVNLCERFETGSVLEAISVACV